MPTKDYTMTDRIKACDFYKDLPKDLAEPTASGATGILFLNVS